MRKNHPYPQGVINTTEHPKLTKGQIVEIVEQNENFYMVRTFLTGKPENVKKEHVSLN